MLRPLRNDGGSSWYLKLPHRLRKGVWIKTILFGAVFVVLVNFLCHPKRFPGYYDYIKQEDITSYLSPALPIHKKPCVFDGGKVLLSNALENLKRTNFSKDDSVMRKTWEMQKCTPYKVSIVVPYRDRSEQLFIFLQYMHWFLQMQLLDYHIYIVEQSIKNEFNRAFLFNVGYIEAQKTNESPCFIFHDVDLLPENLGNLYVCTTCPRHMSSAVNTMRYTLMYHSLFGGVVAILSHQFDVVNGFPNRYFGWGGEDDDMSLRVVNKNLMICRFPPLISRYTMLPHKHSKPNEERLNLLERGREDQETDGLNSIAGKYVILGKQERLRHTILHVEIL